MSKELNKALKKEFTMRGREIPAWVQALIDAKGGGNTKAKDHSKEIKALQEDNAKLVKANEELAAKVVSLEKESRAIVALDSELSAKAVKEKADSYK